jgi:hypothetical protein
MDKFKKGDIEFEIETDTENTCSSCSYYFKCAKLEHPEHPGNKQMTFRSFCNNYLGISTRPISGTLEKNLPHIFQGELSLVKRTTEKEAINMYCKNFCVFECQKSECPLYQFKTNE